MNTEIQNPSHRWPKRYSMMTLLLIALLLCYVDRVLISVAGIEMQREFGWSDSQKGLVFSTFFVGYLCMQVMGGILANRFGGRNVFMLAVLGWSVVTILTPAAAYAGFAVLIVARFLLGFGEGAAYPAAYNLINGWMPKSEVSRSVSLIGAAAAVGTVSALLVIGGMIEKWGWPSVFYLFGGLGLVWYLVWWISIPNAAPNIVADTDTGKSKIPWKAILLHRHSMPVYAAAVAYGSISFTLASWLPSYFVDTFELSLTEAGLYSILPWVVYSVATIIAGILGDRWISRGRDRLRVRRQMLATGMLVSAVACVTLTIAPSAIMAVAITSVIFAGLGWTVPGYIPLPSELFPRHGDVFYGFMAGTGSVASIIVVSLTGILLERTGSYDSLFIILAGVCVFGTIVFHLNVSVTPILAEDRATT